MEEWKEYKLGDISDITKLAGFEFTKYVKYNPNGEIIAIRALNLRDGHLELKDIQRIDKETSNGLLRSKLYKGDIVLSYTGTIGACAIITEDDRYHLAPNVCKITPCDSIEPFFLYYIIRSRTFQESLIGYAHGSTQPTIPMKTIREIPVKLCTKDKQLKIAYILKSLDDKIEVNKRINDNLEQQAQALFKSWFVDFEPFKDGEFVESELGMIPKGWRVTCIGDLPLVVTDYVANGSFASLKENVKLYQEEEYAVFIRNTDLKSGEFGVYVDKHSYDFLSKSRLYGGEIIISNVGDVGSVYLCPHLNKPMTLGNNIIMVKADEDTLNTYLYILFKWSYGQGLIQSITGGSAQPKFNKTDFKSLKLILPSNIVIDNYVDKLTSMMRIIEKNKEENYRLATLRDTLLPRLMSGELKINDIHPL